MMPFYFYLYLKLWISLSTILILSNASETSSTYLSGIDERNSQTDYEPPAELIDDTYIDPSKYERASYRHEQALLANIYDPNRTFLYKHDDTIRPFNFTYFTFNELGTFRLILISSRGDADLYISTRDKHVSYENYEYSSCTCGIDEMVIDAYMKRPVYIGVYGYSQYQISHYRLLVELIDSEHPIGGLTLEKFTLDGSEKQTDDGSKTRPKQKSAKAAVQTGNQADNELWSLFVSMLNILLEVLA